MRTDRLLRQGISQSSDTRARRSLHNLMMLRVYLLNMETSSDMLYGASELSAAYQHMPRYDPYGS